MARGVVARRHRGQYEPTASGHHRGHQTMDVHDRRRIGEHDIRHQRRSVPGQHLQVRLGREALGLARLRGQVQRDEPAGRGRLQRLQQLRHQQVRQHAGEPRAGTQHHPVGLVDGLHRFAAGRRVVRLQVQRDHRSGGAGDRHLTDHPGHLRRSVGVRPEHVGDHHQRDRTGRQHPPGHAEQPADQLQCLHRVVGDLGDAGQQQVADGMAAERTAAGEPVLQDLLPGPAPVVLASQGGECHPQVAGREGTELVPEPTAGAPVVSDRHDRGEVRGDPAQGPQGGPQAVPATEGDHPWPVSRGARRGVGHRGQSAGRVRHSRPRSRCTTWTSMPSLASRWASCSVIATLRCLPPVQPTPSRA